MTELMIFFVCTIPLIHLCGSSILVDIHTMHHFKFCMTKEVKMFH